MAPGLFISSSHAPGLALCGAGVIHPVFQCTPANASPRSRACIPSKLYTLDPASEDSPIRCVRPPRSGLAMMYAAADQLSSSARKMRSQKLSCQSRTSRRRRASSAARCFHSTKMSNTDSVRACASSRTWAWSGIKQYARTSMRRVEAVVKSCDAMIRPNSKSWKCGARLAVHVVKNERTGPR